MDRADKELNRAFYDSEREDDRRRFAQEPSKVFHAEVLVPWISSRLAPGSVMLDVAGGSGEYASRIVRAAPVSVVGLDISDSMVRQRGDDPMLALNVVGDMEALPFASGAFDAVMFVACLHHVPDPLPALREAYRVLRPGGLLFAAEPVSLRASPQVAEPIPGHPHEFRLSRRLLLDRVRTAGFAVDDVTGKRLTIRIISLVWPRPSIGLFRAADRVDRALGMVGLDRLGEIALVRASRPGTAARVAPTPDPASLVACPQCREPLGTEHGQLACSGCGRTYAIDEGVQILLADTPRVD